MSLNGLFNQNQNNAVNTVVLSPNNPSAAAANYAAVQAAVSAGGNVVISSGGSTPYTPCYMGSTALTPSYTKVTINPDVRLIRPAGAVAAPFFMNTLNTPTLYGISSITYSWYSYLFTVSGITVTPTVGATYTNNSNTFTVVTSNVISGSGTITLAATTLGAPSASGTLTKTSGTGDATITFSAQTNTRMALATVQCSGTPVLPNVNDTIIIDGDINFETNGDHLVYSVNAGLNQFTWLQGAETNLPYSTGSVGAGTFTGAIVAASVGDYSTLTVIGAPTSVLTIGQNIYASGVISGSIIANQTVSTYVFGVSGVTTAPTQGTIYENNSNIYTVQSTNITAGSGTVTATYANNGSLNPPTATGSLYKEYVFTVSGITTIPTAGAIYTNNSNTFTVVSTSITAGSGTITAWGTGVPSSSGTLTKTSGTGDATITFSAQTSGIGDAVLTFSTLNYTFLINDIVTTMPTVGAVYTNNGSTFTVVSTTTSIGGQQYGSITCAGTGAPSASGTLTKTSGTGDSAILFSSFLTQQLGGAGIYTVTQAYSVSSTTMNAIASQIVYSVANTDITITGNGILDGNFVKGGGITTSSYLDSGIMMNNVARLTIGGGDTGFLTLNDFSEYTNVCARIVDAKYVGIHSDNSTKDGIHLYGPQFGTPKIRKVTGVYGDDCAIFQPVDGVIYQAQMPYAIYNGTNVYGGNFYEGGIMQDIKVSLDSNTGQAVTYPSCSQGGSYIGTTFYKMHGIYKYINCGSKAPQNLAGYNGLGVNIGGGYMTDYGYVEEVYIDGVKGGLGIGGASSSKILFCSKATIAQWNTLPIGEGGGGQFDFLKMNKLSADINHYNNSASTGSSIINFNSSNCNISDVKITGCLTTFGGAGVSIIKSAGATIGTIHVIDFSMNGQSQIFFGGNPTFTGTPTVICDGIDISNSSVSAIGIGNGSQAINFKVTNCKSPNVQFFNLYGSGNPGVLQIDAQGINPATNGLVANGGANATFNNIQPCVPTQRVVPVSGGTVTLYNRVGAQRAVIAPAGTLAALTIALPANPIDGEWIALTITQIITTLTQTNGTLVGLPSTTTANYAGKWRYSLADTAWLPMV